MGLVVVSSETGGGLQQDLWWSPVGLVVVSSGTGVRLQ